MAFIVRAVKTIRSHWKKTLLAAGMISYGGSYGMDKYRITQLMRCYCEEAARHGEVVQDIIVPSKRILVILNPTANKRSAEETFEKYCGPILYLAGYLVDIVKTDSVGHSCRFVEELEKLPDYILVAGGDGTVSEVVTGLLRRQKQDQCPIGVLPLGRMNSIAQNIFKLEVNPNRVETARNLAECAMSAVRGKAEKRNIMKIEVTQENEQDKIKTVYAAGSIEWGAFRDVVVMYDKYWYFGPLRQYAAAFFNTFGNKITWKCDSYLTYTPPCPGCSNCHFQKPLIEKPKQSRWWSHFIPTFRVSRQLTTENNFDYSKTVNANCTKLSTRRISPIELVITPSDSNSTPELKVTFNEVNLSSIDFILECWARLQNNKQIKGEVLSVRTLDLSPETVSTEQNVRFYSIDSEAFEVRRIKVSVVPEAICVFTS